MKRVALRHHAVHDAHDELLVDVVAVEVPRARATRRAGEWAPHAHCVEQSVRIVCTDLYSCTNPELRNEPLSSR
eukprot:COSAG01_NODE_63419_length_280_cov_0.574586_1_plen_73_part_10